PTSIAREAIYTVLKEKYPTRRNLESPEAEFSVPLTIFGAKTYPQSLGQWFSLVVKTGLQILVLKPYFHFLILELNATDSRILDFWLNITRPNIIVGVGNLPNHPQLTAEQVVKIPQYETEFLTQFLETAAQIGEVFNIGPETARLSLEKFELPQGRLKFAAGKDGRFIIDSTYYFFPPPRQAIDELLKDLRGQKVILVEKTLQEEGVQITLPVDPSTVAAQIERAEVVVVRGPRQQFQPILEYLTPQL
ncbi:hypothetical protein L6258_01300, partial [Candidatus Parcubacteria bacterium]|nr:hypothetical protein [Candidatus Parcubacteria bacterium]